VTAPAPDVVLDNENPWPGLISFPEEGEAFFNGRESERDDLLRLIRREPMTLLYGASGLGKTSLLMAGLFPALRRENFLPVYIRIDHSPTSPRPTEQMRSLLLAACAVQHVDAPVPAERESLWEYLHRREDGFWSDRNHPVTPVFVLDQFEELLTRGAGTAEQDARSAEFVASLGDLINNAMPAALEARLHDRPEDARQYAFRSKDYRVVIGAREDFVPELEQHLRSITGSLMQTSVRLTRMSGEQACEAISRTGGHLVTAEVADRIVRFLAGGADAQQPEQPLARLEVEPALLSVFCRELNEKRKARGAAVIEADLIRTSKEEILADFYQRSTADLGVAVRAFIEDELLTGSGYRDSRALEDALRRPGVTRAAIDALVARRLLRVEERFGVKRVELTHDVLTGIVRSNREQRHELEREAQLHERAEAEKAQLRARAARARARNRTTAALAVLFLLVAIYSLVQAHDATVAKATADKATALARTMGARDSLLAVHALTAQRNDSIARAAAERAQARLTIALAQVQQTNRLHLRDDSIAQQKDREMSLTEEWAGDYRQLEGQIRRRQATQDTALHLVAAVAADSSQRATARAAAQLLDAARRGDSIEKMLCAVLTTVPANAADAAAFKRFTVSLASVSVPSLCASRNADGTPR
jgi:hypothetical protein